MTAATRSLVLLATVAAISAGCGGASGHVATTTASTGATTPSAHVRVATLKAAVRSAISADRQLSLYVLWNNRVPSWASKSTRGPALSALRSGAATRRKQGIRLKNLSGSYTVVSIKLALSYASATAVITSTQRVAPYTGNRRLGNAISETDHARVQLHRVGNAARFVVWRLSPIR
jgi:hypothetical protein